MSIFRRSRSGTGGHSRGPGSTTGGTTNTNTEPTFATRKNEYEDDGSIRMPVLNSPAQLAAARRMVRQLSAKSGRSSTALASDNGVRPYTASLLGSTT